jgi:hypothetical protein
MDSSGNVSIVAPPKAEIPVLEGDAPENLRSLGRRFDFHRQLPKSCNSTIQTCIAS